MKEKAELYIQVSKEGQYSIVEVKIKNKKIKNLHSNNPQGISH